MKRILEARNAIYDQFQSSSAGVGYFFEPQNADQYAAYYTSMYLVQDTAEAVSTHMATGFSANGMQAYLEFWGVMQAVVIQQEAIFQIHQAVIGKKPKTNPKSAWSKLCDTRNLCAGHPAYRTHRNGGKSPPQRAFMGRRFGGYGNVTYELWDAQTSERTSTTFNLGQMINDYDLEAGIILGDVLTAMKTRWP